MIDKSKTYPVENLLNFCIINVDKPAGITSFDVCEKVKNIFNANKVGHFGTLDPMVTGVLPVALNRACRLSNYFMKKDKEYVGKMYLHSEITEAELKKEMEKFIGKIMQKPPVKSRVKRVLRERIVNKFKILDKKGKTVEFHSDVQAGTYIRKLISDLGERIGGAHMIELRRIRAGIFNVDESHSLEEIKKAYEEYQKNFQKKKFLGCSEVPITKLDDFQTSEHKKGSEQKLRDILIPAEIIQRVITRVNVKEESLKGLLNGKPLNESDLLKNKIPNSELISVFCKEKLVGIYRKSESQEIIAKPEFVMN